MGWHTMVGLLVCALLPATVFGQARTVGPAAGATSISPAATTITITSITVDEAGAVRLVRSDGKEVVPPKEPDQVGSSSPLLAGNKQAAGWLVDSANCCTSYPISLKLIIYRPGRPLRRFGSEMGIFDWCFVAGGRQVAFYTDTVHGNFAPHFELRDVESGRLLSQWDGHLTPRSPSWTRLLKFD